MKHNYTFLLYVNNIETTETLFYSFTHQKYTFKNMQLQIFTRIKKNYSFIKAYF